MVALKKQLFFVMMLSASLTSEAAVPAWSRCVATLRTTLGRLNRSIQPVSQAVVRAHQQFKEKREARRLQEEDFKKSLALLQGQPLYDILHTSFTTYGASYAMEHLKDIFTHALMSHDFALAEQLYQTTPAVLDARNSLTGNQPLLHAAALRGDEAMMQFLLGHGTCVDVQDQEGYSALMCASSCAVARLLLSYNASVTMTDATGHSVLYHLAVSTQKEGFKNTDGVKELMKECIARGGFFTQANEPTLLLHQLIEQEMRGKWWGKDDPSLVPWIAFFVESGFPLDAGDYQRATALDYAYAHRHHEAVKLLEAQGAPHSSKILKNLYACGISSWRLLDMQKRKPLEK